MGERGKGSEGIRDLRLKSTPRVKPPEDISPEAKVFFEEIVNACKPNHFSVSDIPGLKIYCDALVNSAIAQKKLEEVEWVYTDDRGVEKKTEWLGILKNHQTTASNFMVKLGLCPSSRVDKSKKAGNNVAAPVDSKRADLLG